MTLPSQERSTSRKTLMRRKDKKEGRRHRWLRAGVVVAVLILVLIAAFVGYRLWLNARLNAAIDRIRAAGYPVTTRELAAGYPYPKGKNAADVYERAFKAFVDDEALEKKLPPFSVEAKWPPPGEPLTPEMEQAAQKFLAKNAKTLALIEQAVKIGQTRFPVDFSKGAPVSLPHLPELRRMARLLEVQTELAARQGDAGKFVKSMQTIAGLAHALDNEPVLISYLVKVSLYALLGDELHRGTNELSLSDAQLRRLSGVVAGGIGGDGMVRALAGERVFGLYAPIPNLGFYDFSGIGDLDRLAFLHIMRTGIEYAKNPTGYPPDFEKMEDRVPRLYVLTRLTTPAISAAVTTRVEETTSLQTIRVGLAAMRYRLAHGELPASLNDLTPQYLKTIPTDPFANPQASLRYRRTNGGAVIYSVGKDGKDNGGRKFDKEGNSYGKGTDIAFILKPVRPLSGH